MRLSNTGLVFDIPSLSTSGFILVCPVEGDSAFLLDPTGNVARQWTTGVGMTNWTYLLPNGNLFRNERCDNRRGVALTVSGRLSEYDPNGLKVWTHDDPYQHHDARRLATGAVYASFTEIDNPEKLAISGGIPVSESDGGPYGEAIRQVDESGEVVWEWNFSNLDTEKLLLYRNSNRWSYGHTNTVSPLQDGTYLVSCKNLNLLFIVDPATDKVVWEYQDDNLGGQHDAQMLDNGNILVFANGLYQADLSHSQVWELNPLTREIVWRYIAKDDMTSFYSPHMGGAERLPSGNTLICEGNKGCLFEVTPDNDVVREFISPHFVESEMFGKINWLFRCRWYAPDSPEISSLGL